DHVLEQLGVLGVDRLRVDLDLAELARSRGLHGDHPTARGRLDGLARELLLYAQHLLLHLLGLLHQGVHVEAAFCHYSSTSLASKVSLNSATRSSSLGGA